MFRVIEYSVLNPRGLYWKRTFQTREEAEAAIDRFYHRNPYKSCTLRIYWER